MVMQNKPECKYLFTFNIHHQLYSSSISITSTSTISITYYYFSKMSEKVKSGRVSKTQRHRLLELIKQHRHVGKGQFINKESKKEHNAVWKAVAKELNAMGGSHKKTEQWKKSWIDWKSSVKQQFGRHRAFSNRTGNLPAAEGPKAVDGLDKDVLEFFSKVVVDGDGVTPEGGFEPLLEIEIDDEIEWLDDSQIEVVEAVNENISVPAPKKAPKSRGCTSQSCLEEVKQVCEENQAQIMEALGKITGLLETQNATLSEMLHELKRSH